MPTPLTLRASERSGAPAGRLARLFTRSKAYRPARSSSVRRRSARASSSAAKPLSSEAASVMSVLRASSSNSTALTAPWSVALGLAVDDRLRRAIASSQPWPRSISGRAGVTVPARTCDAQARDCSMKCGGIENDVDDAGRVVPSRGRALVLVQRVLDHHGDGVGRADEVGEQLRSAPPGTRPRNASGRPSAPALAATVR